MSSSSESPRVGGEEDAPFTGFDEIENAFNKVSIAADSLLDSIRDDSLRGKQRQKRNHNKPSQDYYTDSDDDMDDDEDMAENNNNSTPRKALSPYEALTGYESHTPQHDDSMMTGDDDNDGEESLDGSLVNDMQNLRSITRAIQEDLKKSGQVFEANVTKSSDNGKTFFQKLEAAADAKTTKLRNLNLDTSSSISANKRTTTTTPMKSIDIQRNTAATPQSALDTPTQSPRKVSAAQQHQKQQKPPEPSFWEQLRQFCHNLLGKRPNVPLFIVNIVVWAIVFRMAFVAKDYFMNSEGQLSLSL